MAQESYTYDELVKMGAKPGGYTYEEAVAAGAKPSDTIAPVAKVQPADPTKPGYALKEVAKTAWEQMKALGSGAASLVTGIPDQLRQGADIVSDVVTGQGSLPSDDILHRIMNSPHAQQMVKNTVMPVAKAVKTTAQGAAALASPYLLGSPKITPPSDQDFQEQAQVGGALGAMAIAGKVGELVAPKLAPIAETVIKKTPTWVVDKFKPAPVITFLRGMGSTDPTARTWIPKLMDELKAAGGAETVDQARSAIKTRMQDVYNPLVERILEPQKDVVVPGSRAQHLQARIEAIPDRIKLDDPAKYAKMVEAEKNAVGHGEDYTIGQLDQLRKSYERSVKHNQSISASMTADESSAAMDRASMRFAIDKFYDSLTDNSGTGVDVKELKSRIGAMLKGDEALAKRTNRAAIQSGRPMPVRVVEGVGHVMRSGKYADNLGSGVTSNINSDIASAMRRWDRSPADITAPLKKPQLQLGSGSGEFYIDPSAGNLYGNGAEQQAANLVRNQPAQSGGFTAARNVTPGPTPQKLLNSAPLTPTRMERSSGQVFTIPETTPTNRGIAIEGATTGQQALPAGRIIVTPTPPDASRLTVYYPVKQLARDPKTGRIFKYFTGENGAVIPSLFAQMKAKRK